MLFRNIPTGFIAVFSGNVEGHVPMISHYRYQSFHKKQRVLIPHEPGIDMVNLALVILGVVLFTQLVSWIGKSVLLELVSYRHFLHDQIALS